MSSGPDVQDILIVEDNDDIRALYGAVLRRHGYVVHEADNGEAALDVLQQLPRDPCLLLLDLMMPVMSGPELLKRLTESQRLGSLAVVVISAGGKPSDAPQARQFIRKPVDADTLLAVADAFCGPPKR